MPSEDFQSWYRAQRERLGFLAYAYKSDPASLGMTPGSLPFFAKWFTSPELQGIANAAKSYTSRKPGLPSDDQFKLMELLTQTLAFHRWLDATWKHDHRSAYEILVALKETPYLEIMTELLPETTVRVSIPGCACAAQSGT